MALLEKLWWSLISFGFRLLYNELAWIYDIVSKVVSLGKWKTWQSIGLDYLEANPSARILELAHGTGEMQIELNKRDYVAFGLDISPYMGRITRRKLVSNNLPLRLTQASATDLPYPDNTFDAILSTFPTAFIVDPDTLQEASRVLKSGGRLVIVYNGLLKSKNLLSHLIEWLYKITGQRGPWPDKPLRNIQEAGFDVEFVAKELPASDVLMIIATLKETSHRSRS